MPSLLCVPGLGLDRAAWRPATRHLTGRQVEVVTLPGFGDRPEPGDALDPASLGARLARDRLVGRSGVVLAGHSASCQVVAEAAAAAPGVVVGLVLVGPTTDVTASSWPALAGRWLRTAAHEPPRQLPTLVRSYARTGLLNMARTMDAARHHDVRRPLAAAGVPVLVLRGRHDRICPTAWADELIGTGAPDSRAVTLPTGAHMVPRTHGELTAHAVAAFLDAVGRGPG